MWVGSRLGEGSAPGQLGGLVDVSLALLTPLKPSGHRWDPHCDWLTMDLAVGLAVITLESLEIEFLTE